MVWLNLKPKHYQIYKEQKEEKERNETMDTKGLARSIAGVMKESDIRKNMVATKYVLHVTDDDGNRADFALKRRDTAMLFTIEDVETILRTGVQVIEAALQRGESINIRGFGKLEVKYREPRRTKDIETGEWIDVEGRYVPKFTYGADLKTAARLYEHSLNDRLETRIDREGIDDEDLDEG